MSVASAELGRCTIEAVSGQDVATSDEKLRQELVHVFSVLAHDLKSPIFAVDGFSELLLSDYAEKLDDEGVDFLKRIRSSSQQMKRVLDGMATLVKLLSHPLARRPVQLRELVEEVILKYNFQIEEGGVQVDLDQDLPEADVDPEMIREALGALMANALFFTDRAKGDRRIRIDCTRQAGEVRLCVRDNGVGIDPRFASQVFELGGVSKLDRARGGGPGYGLYLAKRLVENHGGAMTVETIPEGGTEFCMTLPIAGG